MLGENAEWTQQSASLLRIADRSAGVPDSQEVLSKHTTTASTLYLLFGSADKAGVPDTSSCIRSPSGPSC